MRRKNLARAVPLCLVLVFFSSIARAQPDQPNDGATSEPSAIELIAAARQAYRDVEVHERVTIAVREGRNTRFDEFIVRLRASADKREMRLEMPTVSIWAMTEGQSGHLAAAHRDNDQVVYEAELDRSLSHRALSRHLPPFVAPQLALAYGERVQPEIADADWTRGPVDAGTRSVVALGREGLVKMCFDSQSHRLKEYRVESRANAIWLRIEPVGRIEPSLSDGWRIRSERRRVVSSLSELRPRPSLVMVGSEFPFKMLNDATMSIWPLAAALADRTVPPQRPEERYLVLVFHRVPSALPERSRVLNLVGDAIEGANEVERELLRVSSRPEGLGPRKAIIRVLVRPVACLAVGDARRANVRQLAERWPLDTGGSGLLWIAPPELTLDRFAPGEDAAIVIVDDQMRLVRVLPLGRTDQKPEVEVRDAIMREVELIGSP